MPVPISAYAHAMAQLADADVTLCPHRWRTAERGKLHEHTCAVLIQTTDRHECRCCCGAVDWEQWDLPARLTPGLKTRR